MALTDDQDGEFLFVKLRPKSFTKYIKCRKDIDRPGWFKCSNRLLEDDDLDNFSAAETCAWLKILSLASEQQSASIRINLLKINALIRKFTRADLMSAIDKLKALGILKSDVTPTLRARNVDVTQRGEDRIGEEKNKAEEREVEIPAPAVLASPHGKFKSVEDFLSSIPALTTAAWTHRCKAHGGLKFVEAAALNALAYHGSTAQSAGWDISIWVSKVNDAIEYAIRNAPAPFEAGPSEPRPRAAPIEMEIAPLTQEEVLNATANAERFGLKIAAAAIENQIAGSAS